eukprot:scaffold37559_cov66-Phaeocystis_antarctica.AAC.3
MASSSNAGRWSPQAIRRISSTFIWLACLRHHSGSDEPEEIRTFRTAPESPSCRVQFAAKRDALSACATYVPGPRRPPPEGAKPWSWMRQAFFHEVPWYSTCDCIACVPAPSRRFHRVVYQVWGENTDLFAFLAQIGMHMQSRLQPLIVVHERVPVPPGASQVRLERGEPHGRVLREDGHGARHDGPDDGEGDRELDAQGGRRAAHAGRHRPREYGREREQADGPHHARHGAL